MKLNSKTSTKNRILFVKKPFELKARYYLQIIY